MEPNDDQKPNEPAPTIADASDPSLRASFRIVPGDSIGPFKILSVIGEGGFGIVFLAEQTEPVKRRVALKVIKAGMDTDMVVARFEAERQALALMAHPGIARVYEAGATKHGRPYFVMEFVQGDPLTVYCDKHKLDTRERLDLFAKVCDAVQHAHQKGVIHRDLKPGNILVTVTDRDEPQPKVIDFGIAKATAQNLTEKTIFTEVGQMIGTPEYMSPEQAEMSVIDIDTRTDVYSLGVTLYELLAGKLPFEPKDLRSKGYAEIQRIIREEDPPRPSTRLTTITSEDPEDTRLIASARQTTIDSLSTTLRRELEWIPLKALRKDRTERYSSAEALGEDVRRYLRGDALEAGPEAAMYRFRKLVKRNKGPFAAAALIALSLVAGIIGTTIFAVEAARQADIAREQRDQAVAARASAQDRLDRLRQLLSQMSGPISDSVANLAGALKTRRRLLEAGQEQLALLRSEAEATGDPVLLHTVGETLVSYGDLLGGLREASEGKLDEALAQYDDAAVIYRDLRTRSEELSPSMQRKVDRMLAWILAKKADVMIESQDPEAARTLLFESRAILEPMLADGDPAIRREYFVSFERLSDMEEDRGNFEAALGYATTHRDAVKQLLDEQQEQAPQLRRGYAMTLRRVGFLRGELDQDVEAEQDLAYSLAIFEEVASSQPHDIRRQRDVGWAKVYLGQFILELDVPRRRPEVVALCVDAAGVIVAVCAAEPKEPRYRNDAVRVVAWVHEVLLEIGFAEEAFQVRRGALLTLQPVLEAQPENIALEEAMAQLRQLEAGDGSG